MKIMHYHLGFPPMRSGGLTKYAVDLMEAEQQLGHDVYALIPGNFKYFSKESRIVEDKTWNTIRVFKITNALPIPFAFGIKKPSRFIERKNVDGLLELLYTIKPDVLHVHTLMGLPIEVLQLFKEHHVRIVMTTHDYFGLCPRVNFINYKGEFCDKATPEKCALCCKNSKGLWYLKLRNSPLLLIFKKLFR